MAYIIFAKIVYKLKQKFKDDFYLVENFWILL